MTELHDTQPNMPPVIIDSGVDAPPRILFWGVIGLFVIIISGGIFGIFAFNNLLNTGQQQRVVEAIPFMDALLIKQPTPIGGLLPTPVIDEASNNAALDLLAMPLSEETAEATADATEDTTIQETSADSILTATAPPTSTTLPTATPTATIMPTATALPTQDAATNSANGVDVNANSNNRNTNSAVVANIPGSMRLYGFTHQQQTWNNCGPATITMALSYYGWQNDQSYAARYLKPNREDKNVSPEELVDFVNSQTAVKALWRIGGDMTLLKRLMSSDFPVVIETGLMPEAYDWIGHYRAMVAYDDSVQTFYMYDSFLGTGDFEEGVTETYPEMDEKWRHFNRTFIVVYEPTREAELMSILGELSTTQGAATIAFNTAQDEARTNPQDPYAWFNMGTALVELMRYEEAANAFDQARRHGLPFRMMWYQFGPFVAYYETGRYEDVQALVQINLNNAVELEETYYWQGRVLLAQGDAARAAVQFRLALRYNPNFVAAQEMLDNL